MAVMPNIDAEGAPSMAFHTHPFINDHDPNSGDHGLGWFGSSLNAGSYLHNHPELGALCFMCDLLGEGDCSSAVTIAPRDTYRRRAYFSPIGLWLVAETGLLANLTMDMEGRSVTIYFEPSAVAAAAAGMAVAPYNALRLRFEQAAPDARPYSFTLKEPAGATFVRGAWEFPPAGVNVATKAVLSFQ